MTFQELLARLREAAEGQPHPVFLVGGSVRDGLLGRPLADVDIAVSGDALAYARCLADLAGGAYVPLGERFGTARVALPGPDGEVRQVDCSALQGDIAQDLARRDFTVNALAVVLAKFDGDWRRAAVLDPFAGRADLDARVLRMTSPAVLDDDPLRLLRAVRLAAELGFTIEAATGQAIRERAALLATCAPERQRDELCRTLAVEGAAEWIELLDRLGLLVALLPELADGKGVAQPKEHHWDVFQHQVETVAAAEALLARPATSNGSQRAYLRGVAGSGPWHPALKGYFDQQVGDLSRRTLLKLTALLHDVAKPATKTFEASGRMRFFGHEEKGAQMVSAMLARLRFSSQQMHAAATMVGNHLRPGQWSDGTPPTPRAVFRYFRDLGAMASDTIFLSLADHLAARGPSLEPAAWRLHVEAANAVLAQHFEQQQRTERGQRLLTGRALMEAFGLPAGPIIGRLLAEVEEARAAGAVATTEEALALAERSLAREGAAAGSAA